MVSYGPGSGQIEVDGRSSDHPMLRNTDLGDGVMSVMRGYGGERGILLSTLNLTSKSLYVYISEVNFWVQTGYNRINATQIPQGLY